MRADHETKLESKLNDPAQQAVRSWVKGLPDETPSLEWRSGLNERLLAVRPKVRRPWWFWALGPSLGAAAAIALFASVRDIPATHGVAPTTVEAKLVAAHVEASTAIDLGIQVARSSTPVSGEASIEWNASDLESL